jgi:2-polyprenyl-6-methoxyphenol hydroxylase-like FAD-dependent oxidoreductase
MDDILQTTCCIAGGGPAGLVLGYLLARAGIDVTVLEKHTDFLRDFRGDTIHPSTMTVLQDVGLLDEFLKLPHDEVAEFTGEVYGQLVTIADFRHLPAARPFMALIPQWDFLNFIAQQAREFAGFHLRMGAKATAVIVENDAVVGVQVEEAGRNYQIRAPLTVAADGRHSTLRGSAGLQSVETGAPIDVMWFRVPREPTHPNRTGGIISPGAILVTLNRGTYWQCAFVIPKGGSDRVREQGLDAFRDRIVSTAPFLAGSVRAIASWGDVKLLSVQIDHLVQWYRQGFLCIGDAAHAMSPVGGVGINLAIQDAVAASNLLTASLEGGAVTLDDLAAVQHRRAWPARVTQRLQVAIQNEVLSPALARTAAPGTPPLPFRLLRRLPVLRRFPARIVGLGVRPERVMTRPL